TSPSVENIVSALLEYRGDATEVNGKFAALSLSPADDEEFDELGVQTDVGVSDVIGRLGGLAGLEGVGPGAVGAVADGDANENTVLAREMLEECLAERLPEAVEGQGVGAMLLYDAIARICASPIGAHAIFADAIDDAAAAFYRKHLFTPFAAKPKNLFLPLATARRLIDEGP
ncbi:MAG: hypothetical protein HYZ60_00080, partial [Methylocystis sp.]|nr:hypothetical protein [Methylocystis sp.]